MRIVARRGPVLDLVFCVPRCGTLLDIASACRIYSKEKPVPMVPHGTEAGLSVVLDPRRALARQRPDKSLPCSLILEGPIKEDPQLAAYTKFANKSNKGSASSALEPFRCVRGVPVLKCLLQRENRF